MKLFNTKTNAIETFVPIHEKQVSLYVCGPTVHDKAHIGNARPLVVFDTLKKTLEALGYSVDYVSNYTDVDDRIIEKAQAENIDETEYTEHYIDLYETLRQNLGAHQPNATPRVTETMEDIIQFIEALIEAGAAYEAEGDVYFSVDYIDNYGSLSHQNLEELQVGSRVKENVKKQNPLDFTLWKKTETGIAWPTRWSTGRPGWHTECVVMINQHFKQPTIDIHGGGQDLKFPHHENENAQQEALHQHGLANYWIHNAMVNIDGGEMHKSLGNAVDAQELIDQLGSNVVRWLLISTHYRQVLNLTDQTITQAKAEIERIEQALKSAQVTLLRQQFHSEEDLELAFYPEFLSAMKDDLNTPNAIKIIFDAIKALNASLRTREVNYHKVNSIMNEVYRMLNILGISFKKIVLSAFDIELFDNWDKAKQNRDFERADQIRAQLQARGLL